MDNIDVQAKQKYYSPKTNRPIIILPALIHNTIHNMKRKTWITIEMDSER